MKKFNLSILYKIIEKRIQSNNKNSYSYKLYKNPKLLNKKVLEEAAELTKTKNKKQVIWETADLLYFLLVFLVKRGVSLEQIEIKLRERNKNKEKLIKLKKETKMKKTSKTNKKLNILFVCKYNVFRSRVAETYFNKINKNKNIKVKSAGVIKGSFVNKEQIATTKKLGLDIREKPKGLSTNLLIWQNMIVIVADDVPPSIFSNSKKYGKKVIVWKIKDVKGETKQTSKRIRSIKKIMKKVNKLVKNLNQKRG